MIINAIILSLQICGIKVCFMEGMILGWLRIFIANFLDLVAGRKWSKIIQKPLFECYACMAGLWTVILTWSFDIKMILLVCGINYITDKIIPDEYPSNT